jgi:hypothetical protein
MPKPDAKRWRPVGTYAKAPHKPILKKNSRALSALNKITPTKHNILFQNFDYKPLITDFNNHAQSTDSLIYLHTLDVKNFFTDITLNELLFRVKFYFQFYKNTFHTNYISFPKFKKDKHLPIIPGFTNDPLYYCISLTTLLKAITIALNNCFFVLGPRTILRQILGLAIGCPLSPPLAILYLAYDEHHSHIPALITQHKQYHLNILLSRYVDDVNLIISISSNHPNPSHLSDSIAHYVQFNMYDQKTKTLFLKRTNSPSDLTTKFLDTNPTIHPSRKSIKLVYHTVNKSFPLTLNQEIGRFYDPHANTHFSTKISPFTCICVRMHDLTSHQHDMIPPLLSLCAEATYLNYHPNSIISFLTKAHQIRPSPIFPITISLLNFLHQNPPIPTTSIF